MDRRTFLSQAGVAAAAATLLPARARAAVVQDAAIDVVERFGFSPDGRTDNYEAFHRLADFANRQGGGRFVFRPGDYAVRRYRTVEYGSTAPDAVRNAPIVEVDGLALSGKGARILLNGRFHRSGQIGRDGLTLGVHNVHFMPFDIRRSRNILIEGFEVDGGARDTTRDPNVFEGFAHLVSLNACSNVELRDLDLHHGLADGVQLNDDLAVSNLRPGRACRDVRLTRVRCRNNARGGLAPIQVLGLTATDCDFSGNGFPGPHGGHAPGFGIDIEPDHRDVGVNVDTRTGNLEFRNCTLFDNQSAILAAYPGSYIGYCRFIDCSTRNANNGPNHMILSWPGEGMLIQGGEHDGATGCIYTSWQQTGSTVRLRGLKLRSSNTFGILHAHAGNLVMVEDCDIVATHQDASAGQFIFFGQDPGGGRRNIFRGNRVFIPAVHKQPGAGFDVECLFNNTDLSDNEYRTDLARPGEWFVRHFVQGACTVRNERFYGAFPGREDTFRPVFDASHDTRLPFSAG